MKKINKIGMIGAGALGILYGQKLTQAYGREHVFFAADEKRVERYRNQGFTCNGIPCDFRYVEWENSEAVDLLIFAVKYTGLEEAIAQAASLVSEDTLVISVLNGISSEELLAKAYGQEHILYSVAQGMDAVKDGNALTYQNTGVLVLGSRDSGRADLTEAVEAVTKVITDAGIVCRPVDDIMHRMWSKLMLNTGVNQVTAVLETDYGSVQVEGKPREMMLSAMYEVQQVAEAEGILLTKEDIDAWLDLIDSLNPKGMPSMRQDTKAHRKTEVELFSGTVCRLGKQYGIPTPVNDFLYERIRKMEAEY